MSFFLTHSVYAHTQLSTTCEILVYSKLHHTNLVFVVSTKLINQLVTQTVQWPKQIEQNMQHNTRQDSLLHKLCTLVNIHYINYLNVLISYCEYFICPAANTAAQTDALNISHQTDFSHSASVHTFCNQCTKSQFKSLDFVINSAMRKIFDTKSQDIVDACREIFNCSPAESAIASRRRKFLEKITVSENKLCYIFADNAIKELCVVNQAWRFGCMPATILNVVHAYYSEIATT